MGENPYQTPASLEPQPGVPGAEETVRRPVGVTILAVLHWIGGLLFLGVLVFWFVDLRGMEGALSEIGVPPALFVLAVVLLAAAAIASGIGMWLGKRWGWWLAAFYYLYSVLNNAGGLVAAVSTADQLEDVSGGPKYAMLKHGVRIVVHFLLLLYFFRAKVLRFFDLAELNKLKAIGIFVGMYVAMVVLMAAIMLLAS